mmetsp:Transcript_26716/g.77052  ORF Transcript_26716/g.77052 Transcript_26716/m.77052 type:complete len:289 (+) Transcript_26716:1-867(+)
MPSHLETLTTPAGDAARAGTTQETPAGLTASAARPVGTGTAKKRRRRLLSTGSTCISADAEADGDPEFSINSSSSSSDDEDSASTGRGALMAKQKTLKRASASSNKKRRADESGMTGSAAAAKDSYHANKARRGQQQWTELTAVCHVFSDEVQKYMNPIEEADQMQKQQQPYSTSVSSKRRKKQPPHLSMGEKKHLNNLVERVKERVDRQSGVVLENRKLVKAAKAAKCKVRDLRNDIMITRLLTGKLEAEVSSLEKQVRQRKGDEKKMQQASNFLSSIEALARSSCT